MLSWIERKAAAALFASPPTASIDQALENFLKVRYLKTTFLNNTCMASAKLIFYLFYKHSSCFMFLAIFFAPLARKSQNLPPLDFAY